MIHMLQNLNDVNFLIGTTENIRKIKLIPARKVFDSRVVDFLSDLASFLLKDQFAKKYQDIIAFAFWIRKSSLKKVAEIYEKENRIGRGTVFHIAPSNIPVQFAVSLVYALVAGNASIIRISDKEFEQVDILCKAINDLVQDKYKIWHHILMLLDMVIMMILRLIFPLFVMQELFGVGIIQLIISEGFRFLHVLWN